MAHPDLKKLGTVGNKTGFDQLQDCCKLLRLETRQDYSGDTDSKLYFSGQKVHRMKVVNNCFLWKVVRQNDTDVTSFCMQFEKIGRGLLQKVTQLAALFVF